MQTRRGFTLLEMTLAMTVGVLVLGTALSIMLAVSRTDKDLAARAEEQSEMTRVQFAVSEALTNLRPAPDNTVRGVLDEEGLSDDEIDAYLDNPMPEPLEGASFRFEMGMEGELPRIELVADRVPAGPDTSPENAETGITDEETGTRLTYDDLAGYRGVFELVRRSDGLAYELYWRPLAPKDLPANAWFDETTLPAPTRLTDSIRSIRWTAFIDREKLDGVRAIEARQLPAYIELDITTIGGLTRSWMFELGWMGGAEVATSVETEDELSEGLLPGGGA